MDSGVIFILVWEITPETMASNATERKKFARCCLFTLEKAGEAVSNATERRKFREVLLIHTQIYRLRKGMIISMKKGQICEGYVERLDFPNKGILNCEDEKVVVKNVQLSEQDEDLKKKNVLYTGNYMVDAIINGIIAKEAYSDVKFHCEGKLPRKLMIQDVDLSGLLSNGLENAAEACLHSNGDKCVLFKAASYENMIHFEIKNTYDSTRYKALSKGDFETTKKNSEYHGYGIESMRCVVKKYDGKLEYIVEPEWVITDIYLQQKDEI